MSRVVGKSKGNAFPLLGRFDGRFRPRVAFDRQVAFWSEHTAQILCADRLRQRELTPELPLHGASVAVNTRRLGVDVEIVAVCVDEDVFRPEAAHVQLQFHVAAAAGVLLHHRKRAEVGNCGNAERRHVIRRRHQRHVRRRKRHHRLLELLRHLLVKHVYLVL